MLFLCPAPLQVMEDAAKKRMNRLREVGQARGGWLQAGDPVACGRARPPPVVAFHRRTLALLPHHFPSSQQQITFFDFQNRSPASLQLDHRLEEVINRQFRLYMWKKVGGSRVACLQSSCG